jgi:hypothetical protein
MGQRPNSMMSKVVPQPLFAVAPEQGLLATKAEPIESLLQVKPQAPVSDIGFYSATEQAALNLGRNKGTGQSFINDLMKAPDVKKEELVYTGLDDFLRDKPNVTKQEVQDFLANNRVDVKEVRKSDSANTYSAYGDDADGYFVYDPNGSREVAGPFKTMYEAEDKADRLTLGAAPKYEKYQLAGGENYREILLTLPSKNPTFAEKDLGRLTELSNKNRSAAENIEYKSLAQQYDASLRGETTPQYQSSHFDQPNILAHMRVNDRIDADGKKMLLVEEIQSDWHQAGRERGYGPKYEESFMAYYDTKDGQRIPIGYGKTKEEAEASIDVGWKNQVEIKYETHKRTISEGVPDAPFKDTWYQLALKRLTKYAAENGYERIGLTTGKQQAGRYKLSNEVDEINVIGRTNMATGEKSKSVALDMKSGQSLRIGVNNDGIVDNVSDESIKNFMGKNLSEVVGKDIAKEIMLNNKKTISGEGLDIGGEGMKKYYDEIYPKFLDKYGKKYGASVGETQITTDYARDASGIPAQRPSKETIRYLDITPQMKEGTSKGQPLFAATPLLPATSLLDEEKRKEITSLLE